MNNKLKLREVKLKNILKVLIFLVLIVTMYFDFS